MKRIAICVMMVIFFLTACSVQKDEEQNTEITEAPEVSALVGATESPEPEETVEPTKNSETVEATELPEPTEPPELTENPLIGTKIKPLLSERIDTSKQGINMVTYMRFSTQATKGDDGACYYFRNEGKGKKQKIVFYKNNGIKVCETTMKKSLKKKRYYIMSFVKYGKNFFVFLKTNWNQYFLSTIDAETGKWGEIIKMSYICHSFFIYDNQFYCLANGSEITIYNLDGTKTQLKDLCPPKLKIRVYVQCIVDDKIYYVREEEVKDQEYVSTIMRCNLDGSGREKLLKCSGEWGHYYPGNLKIDGESMYFTLDYNKLFRIPLYGGEIKGVERRVVEWYELSDDAVFLYESDDNGDVYDDTGKIYKSDKNFRKEPKVVTKAYDIAEGCYYMSAVPFYYTDGHLLVKGYNKKEHKVVDVVKNDEFGSWSSFAEITTNYTDDYYWVTEDGEVEDIIKGSGVKERWKKIFKHLRPNSKINLDEL